MSIAANKKNKIVLSDYNYKRDIENRILMSQLSVLEVDVLHEILNNSLRISIKNLVESLEISTTKIYPILDKLGKTKLLSYQGDVLTIDKEMRKYYEFQILKYDDNLELGLEYLQGLLSKVPIHVLPLWYAIPRSSDHIFSSIVEKYLQTPKIYERYLTELQFENPIINGIIQDVFAAPNFKVQSRELRDKYRLTQEAFEEYMLYLEFNFICCLSYKRVDDMWKEVVTPFYEWKEYLLFLRNHEPKTIAADKNIQRKHPQDFGFIDDLNAVLKTLLQMPLPAISKNDELTFGDDTIKSWLPNLSCHHISRIIFQMLNSSLALFKDGFLYPTEKSKEWLKKSIQDQAITLYRFSSFERYSQLIGPKLSLSDRDIREAEKSLKRVLHKGWVCFEDFMKGQVITIGNAEPVMLKKGKRWKYMLPSYSSEEKILIEMTIFERLYEVGMVAVGTYQDKPCFCITPFGRMAIGE